MGRWGSVSLMVCAAVFAAAFLGSSSVARAGFPLDDAWIHLVYARSVIEGHGLAYNSGQLETGLTAPLWTALITPWVWIQDLVLRGLAIKALGVCGLLVTAWFSAATVRVVGAPAIYAWVCALAVVLDPHSMLGALSGMEVTLTSALLATLVHALVAKRISHAVAAMFLLPLARPEAIGVVGLGCWIVARAESSHASPHRRVMLALSPWCGALGWAVYCVTVSGYVLPSTFYAKASPSLAAWAHNARVLPEMLLGMGWFRFGLGLALVIAGAIFAWRASNRVLLLVPLLFLASVFLSQPLKEAHTFYWVRYVLPAMPSLITLMTLGAWRLTRSIHPSARPPVLALFAAAWIGGWSITVSPAIAHYAGSCQNIADSHVPVAHWLREHTQAGEWIATHDAGVIRFMSERPVLDLAGLNNHRVVHGHLAEELARTQPRYFAVFPSWFPVVERDRRFHRVFSAKANHYVISSAAQAELVVYRFDP